jgi:hypothetical protein
VLLDPIQTRLTPGPAYSPSAGTYSYQNQDVPRSGARPTTPRPAHNSFRAASAISWRPTPPAPTGQTERPKLHDSSSSSVASSDADSACRSSNPDSGKTRCVACRWSQTPPPSAELPLAYVFWALPTFFLWSSSYFNTDPTPRTGVLVERLRLSFKSIVCEGS